MKDLVARLRDTASKGVSVWGDLQMEAAKEIEILTAEREAYASAMDRMQAALQSQQAEPTWLLKTTQDLAHSIAEGVYDTICPEEHARHEGKYTVPLYTADAIAQARVQAITECAKVCESTVWSADIDVWRDMTKKDVSVKSMLACADAIRALIGKETPPATQSADLEFRPDWSGVDVLATELRDCQAALVKCVEALQMFYASENTELRRDEYEIVCDAIAEAERVL